MENSITQKKTLWWEKTVEWRFVTSLCQEKNLQAAPLGGNSEAAESDAMISFKGKLALLEFKREYNDCLGLSEMQKYSRDIADPDDQVLIDRFRAACKVLKNNENFPAHTSHFFVYGVEPSTPAQNLELQAASYWYRIPINTPSIVDTIINGAVEKGVFEAYVRQLAALRNYKESDKSGGASVLGFEDGRIVVMDILDYARQKKMLPKKSKKKKNKTP